MTALLPHSRPDGLREVQAAHAAADDVHKQ